ncbi:hypothetical protein [Brevibacterium sp. Mu109]|nr:hypothetical protein [Brevibacterium sp. Mu109]
MSIPAAIRPASARAVAPSSPIPAAMWAAAALVVRVVTGPGAADAAVIAA